MADWTALSEGCYLLRSNVSGWSDEDLWRAYSQWTEVETAFRIPKSDLSSRPIWHQKEDRVLAHLLVCFLAYGLWKFLGRNSASKPASVTNRGGCWQRCVSYAAWT